jgi:microcompartment protein CcmL/EutN
MNAIGLIELSSIAAGMQAADMMLKTSAVELILARTICAGKYMVLVGGDVASVQASVAAAEERLEESIIDCFVIPNVHPDLFPALSGTNEPPELEALGILESFSVASLIEGADAACKAAHVHMIELRLAMGSASASTHSSGVTKFKTPCCWLGVTTSTPAGTCGFCC